MGEIATALVSIIIVTYNSREDIVDCVNSVLNQTFDDFEVIIVDNNSMDDTVEQVKRNFDGNPKVSLVTSKSNTGYAGGNNLGFQHSKGELIVVLNPDAIVARDWLKELLDAYYENEVDAGIVCSNVLLFHDKSVINACGNDIHLTGLVFSRFYMESECSCAKGGKVVPAPSGASMLFSREKMKSIGRAEPFDACRFYMEYSDIDLAIDFLAHDLHCYVAAESKVYHKYKFKMTPRRLYILEKGRYQLLGHFTKSTRMHLVPALLLAEVVVWGFILSKRPDLAASKLMTWGWYLANAGSFQRDGHNSPRKDFQLLSVMVPTLVVYQEMKNNGSVNDKSSSSYLVRRANSYFKKVRDGLIDRLALKNRISD